jgi:hypothetical protein
MRARFTKEHNQVVISEGYVPAPLPLHFSRELSTKIKNPSHSTTGPVFDGAVPSSLLNWAHEHNNTEKHSG